MPAPEGTPIWFELNAADQDAAQAFYEAVAGWRISPSTVPDHGGYRLAQAGGEPVAGIRHSTPDAPGLPGWVVYLASDDVDRAAARVVELGGRVGYGPTDIPQVGRFAMVSDPQGCVFALMSAPDFGESPAFKPMPLDPVRTLGHGVWIELATPDPAGALTFYGGLLGWETLGAMPMGESGEYTFIGRGDLRPGAMMSSTATGVPPRWNWYVHVGDIDAAVATAQARGGTLLQGPDPIPGGSYSATITDPTGHRLGLAGPRHTARGESRA